MNDASPQFQLIQAALSADIDQGLLPDGRLAGERELAERFGCSRMTLRDALQRMETQGLIYRSNRRGWFVSPPRIRYDPTRTQGFMDYVAAQGRTPRTELLAARRRAAGREDGARLQLGARAPVFELLRRRWVDDRAVLVERNVLDAAWCPDLLGEPLDTSLTWLLRERFGLSQSRCHVDVQADVLPPEAAGPLDALPGAPTLCIQRVCHAVDAQGLERPVEFDCEFWLPQTLVVSLDTRLP